MKPNDPPTDTASPPPARFASGRKVLLLVVFLVPFVIVPLLLSGPSHERQVCLYTLLQREGSHLVVGSVGLRDIPWTPVDAWPEPVRHPRLLAPVGKPLAPTPAEYDRLMRAGGPDPGNYWMASERSMPFAFVMSISNTRALAVRRQNVVELRLLAASVLDPANAADRECWTRLDRLLREGFAPPAPGERVKRRPPPTAAEDTAERLLGQCLVASGDPDPRSAVRAVLCAATGS